MRYLAQETVRSAYYRLAMAYSFEIHQAVDESDWLLMIQYDYRVVEKVHECELIDFK